MKKKILTIEDTGFALDNKLSRVAARTMLRIVGAEELNDFVEEFIDEKDVVFASKLIEKLNTNVKIFNVSEVNLPKDKGVLIVANLPHGAIDVLATVTTIARKFPDTKLLINSVLMQLPQIADLALATDDDKPSTIAKAAIEHLQNGGKLIYFPAHSVEGLNSLFSQPTDKKWHSSILKVARVAKVPVVPLFIEGHNDLKYLITDRVLPKFAQLLAIRELLNKRDMTIRMVLGNPFYYDSTVKSVHVFANMVRVALYTLQEYLLNLDEGEDFAKDKVVLSSGLATMYDEKWVQEVLTVVRDNDPLFEIGDFKAYFLRQAPSVQDADSEGSSRVLSRAEKIEDVGYFAVFKGEKLAFCSKIAALLLSMGEKAHSQYSSGVHFEFLNNRLSMLIDQGVEFSDVYTDETIVSKHDLGEFLTAFMRLSSRQYLWSPLTLESSRRGRSLELLLTYLNSKPKRKDLARHIISRRTIRSVSARLLDDFTISHISELRSLSVAAHIINSSSYDSNSTIISYDLFSEQIIDNSESVLALAGTNRPKQEETPSALSLQYLFLVDFNDRNRFHVEQ